jgi:hypothetical protein
MVGMILCAASPSAGGYLAGQVFNGIGIAVQELMAIAAIAEIVPTRYRGYYIAAVVASFLPFAPGSLYGALIAQHNWRYCACMIAIWNLLTAGVVWWFYNPPPRTNTAGLSKIEKVKRIDSIGGLIMTAGLVFLLISLNWGGQQYPWNEAKVIAFLTLGIALLILFFVYEKFFATYPMFPSTLLRHPRTFMALMVVILLAGINYVALLVFWVLEAVSVFDSSQFELGVRTMPYGFCIVGGAIISAILISAFKRHLRLTMTGFCVVQVVGKCLTSPPAPRLLLLLRCIDSTDTGRNWLHGRHKDFRHLHRLGTPDLQPSGHRRRARSESNHRDDNLPRRPPRNRNVSDSMSPSRRSGHWHKYLLQSVYVCAGREYV